MEDVKGSIEVGKFADFCVIGEDILSVDPHKDQGAKFAAILATVPSAANATRKENSYLLRSTEGGNATP